MIKHGTITRLRTASIKESVSRFVNHERNSFGCATHVPSLPDIIFHAQIRFSGTDYSAD